MNAGTALISAAQAGDGDAFAELYRLHHPTIHGYIRKRIAGDPQLAEDLTQETFLRAYRRLDQFVWRGRPFGAWLITIARNILLDEIRRSDRRREVLAGEYANWDIQTVASAEALVVAELDTEPVRAALSSLSPRWREVLILQYWGGLSTAQIGERLGISPGAVKTLTCRARQSLRELVTAV